MEIIDAHHHFWHYHPERDLWINDKMSLLKRDYLPKEFKRLHRKNKIKGTIAVQADPSEEETLFLLEQSRHHSFIRGIVGWIDMLSPGFTQSLEHFSSLSMIKGFRHILQDEPKGFMLQQTFVNAIAAMGRKNLTYDVLITEKQLVDVVGLAAQVPESCRLIIDHIAKPSIREGSFDQWERYMAVLAERPNVFVKLSGMVTEANWDTWKQDDLLPYMESVLELFGPSRLMFGSDWPVCLLAAEYDEVIQSVRNFIHTLSLAEQRMILSETAISCYQLDMD